MTDPTASLYAALQLAVASHLAAGDHLIVVPAAVARDWRDLAASRGQTLHELVATLAAPARMEVMVGRWRGTGL